MSVGSSTPLRRMEGVAVMSVSFERLSRPRLRLA
jgi:hypothetical protein